MRWWGRRAVREEVRPVLARAGTAWAGGDWPAGYEAQLREAYLSNPVAQRAVRLVAEGVGSVPLMAADPKVAALVGARSAGQLLLETAAAQVLLHGNAYLQLLDDGRGGLAELFALRPERVSVEADASGWPVAFRYRVGERVSRVPASDAAGRCQLVHVKGFHPACDHAGLGCLNAAAGAVAIHNAATRWNKALLDNAARPSGALVYEPGDGATLSPDQFARLRAEMDGAFSGAANAGRPMLLEGGLRWQAMSMTPADMDFVGLKATAAREIALAFGVPPMLLGLPGDTAYANYREANRALWRQAILPLADKILGALAQGLGDWFADGAVSVAIDRVPALAEDRERLWRQVSGATFLSDAEKRGVLGLG